MRIIFEIVAEIYNPEVKYGFYLRIRLFGVPEGLISFQFESWDTWTKKLFPGQFILPVMQLVRLLS